jgi:uncharacterized protein YgfB (UPF0149 family)
VLSAEGEESLRDLAAIAQIATDTDVETEDQESDYMEVCEYVRQVAASLFLDYGAQIHKASATAMAAPASDQIH